MSTDITKGPRVCPSCGRENVLTALHCSFCFASQDQGVQSTPSPHPPVAFTEPSPFRRIDSAQLWNPGYTGAVLILICSIFGMFTCGIGFLLFIPLAPALYRLYRASQSAEYDTANSGYAAFGVALAIALVIAVSFVITFAAVFYPIAALGFSIFHQRYLAFVEGSFVVGFVIGLLAGGFVAYMLVRAIFPLRRPPSSSGPRPSPSDED